MRSIVLLLAIALVTEVTAQPINYPKTQKVDHVDTYFGTKVSDPYRWLENDDSANVEEWVAQQNKVTFDYLAKIPLRDAPLAVTCISVRQVDQRGKHGL